MKPEFRVKWLHPASIAVSLVLWGAIILIAFFVKGLFQ